MDITRLGEEVTAFGDEERQLAIAYIMSLETGVTRDHCKCDWMEVTPPDAETKQFVRGDAHQDCPLHTREGFLLGFLTYTNRITEALYADGDETDGLMAQGLWMLPGACIHGNPRPAFCFLCWLDQHGRHLAKEL